MASRILIADDEALITRSLADLLADEGFEVVVASDGGEALVAARRLGDTLGGLVTDLNMPGLAGEDLIRALRVDRPWLPVVVISGSAPPGGAEELQSYCGGHGPLALLHKPFASGAVIEAVQQALADQHGTPASQTSAGPVPEAKAHHPEAPCWRSKNVRRMYVAALSHPLSVEYLLLDVVQYTRARDHAAGLYNFVQRTPELHEEASRFQSVSALRQHCRENGVRIAGDLHGCMGEKGPARIGSSLL
jgi:CheY-like chemotaxis protein